MAEYFGSDFIYGALSVDSAILAIVGSTDNIMSSNLIPEDITSLKTINFYTVSIYNGALPWFERTWSIDCRSNNEQESKNLGFRVLEILNRTNNTVGGFYYYAVCSILQTIPPVNDADVYNTPVECRLRRR